MRPSYSEKTDRADLDPETPQRLVGLHFFNPVSRMQLVEVVSHAGVSPEVFAAARSFVGQIDRLPLPVKSAPGLPRESCVDPLHARGDVAARRESATRNHRWSRRAVRHADRSNRIGGRVGLDICLAVAETLKAKLDRPMPAVPDWLRRKVEAGELGHKTGKGIYEWKDGKPAKAKAKPAQNTKMTDRLILPMVNVCVACLREGIVEDQDVVDGAMVTGFAPYRGGPLQYARSRGIENVILAQRELTKKFGERFAPDGSRDGRRRNDGDE